MNNYIKILIFTTFLIISIKCNKNKETISIEISDIKDLTSIMDERFDSLVTIDTNSVKPLIAATFSPFNPIDGSLNISSIKPLAKYLSDTGISGCFIAGTTGESMSLTINERKELYHAWVNATKELGINLKLIAHIGTTAIPDAIELAKYAKSIGIKSIGAMPPFFFKPANAEILAKTMGAIAQSVPDLEFFYYHIPSMTGVDIKMSDFLHYASRYIPNLTGVKFTDYNLLDFGTCVRYNNHKYTLMFGRDEEMLAALLFGAKAFVGSTYNYAGEIYVQLMNEYSKGNLNKANELQGKSQIMINILAQFGGSKMLHAQKSFLKMLGVDTGSVRLPLLNLSNQEYKKLESDLRKAKFLN